MFWRKFVSPEYGDKTQPLRSSNSSIVLAALLINPCTPKFHNTRRCSAVLSANGVRSFH